MGEGTATTSQTRRRRIIERPRLTRLLDESQGRIKMLIAPAGYGKTTLARQWLADKQAVWYTATPASADVAALAANLRATVVHVLTGAGDALIERLSVTGRADEESELLATMLARDLSEWPTDHWLVIDDYHEVSRADAAEKFVETLLIDTPLNVLIVGRKRPRWASARRILYGELFEVGGALLAMTDEEAAALLGETGSTASDLIAMARGWPAVLGLATALGTRPPELIGAPQLYEFFADEIYRRLDKRARRALCELALYDVNGRRLALAELDPIEAERVTAVAIVSGLMTERPDGELELHPLVRTFLQLKLRDERPEALAEIVGRAVRTLLTHRLWDETAALIRQFERDDLLPTLIERSMDELLAAGRTATLQDWLGESTATAPAVLLATAELAFREGRFYEAEALAALAAGDLAADPDLAARASFVAGRAAHVASRETQARIYFETAHKTAERAKLKREAALGALVATIELEDVHAAELLQSLAAEQPRDPSDEVLLADRRLAFETRFGVPVDLHSARAASQLLRFVGDPVVRTSFRNVFGYALVSMGHLEEAAELTDDQLRDVERCRLDFVIPYARAIQAMVASGRRAYDTCASLLDDADEYARGTGDLAALQMATAVRMRMLVSQGAFEDAARRGDIDLSSVTRSMHGELLGVHALALAGLGHISRSRALASEALQTSIGVETTINARCALAVVALTEAAHETALEHASAALERAVHTGMIESLVCAYRGCPQLIVSLLQRREQHEALSLVLTRAGDNQLLASSGAAHAGRSVMSLSPREKEVLALLAQGLSNKEIGQSLFISPVTVKVHVRHIFEKLGVRSRAEAALRAAQLNRD